MAVDKVKGNVATPISQNNYIYCQNKSLDYVDLDGRDMILIDKHLDMNFGWLNIEHMGALIQDESGTWNFFYRGGDSVVLEPIKDSSALNSMDELNEYLNSHIADKSLNRIIYTEEDKAHFTCRD